MNDPVVNGTAKFYNSAVKPLGQQLQVCAATVEKTSKLRSNYQYKEIPYKADGKLS
jgi:hypothetical protein